MEPPSVLVLTVGVAGELFSRDYSMMLKCWKEPDKTAEVVDPARWMHPGDLAVMPDDGYVNIREVEMAGTEHRGAGPAAGGGHRPSIRRAGRGGTATAGSRDSRRIQDFGPQ